MPVLVLVLNKASAALVKVDCLAGCLALPSAVQRPGASAFEACGDLSDCKPLAVRSRRNGIGASVLSQSVVA